MSELFPVGTKISFRPGPRALSNTTGTVSGAVSTPAGPFLVVTCADGRTRKVRPGAATRV